MTEFEQHITDIPEADIHIRRDGIIVVHYKEGTEVTVELQNRMYDLFGEICKDGPRPFVFAAMDQCSVTADAKDNAIQKEDVFPGTATAVVADSLPYKILANFYLKVKRPKKPFKVFNDFDSAIGWLKEFL